MPKYIIGFWYEVNGRTEVEAKSLKEAEMKIKEKLAYSGLDDLKNVDYTDRNYGIC